MALFGKKTGSESGSNGQEPAPGAKPPEFSPDKAAKFFERAHTVHETTNYEYAMSLWLQGLRWNPTNVEALKSFFDSAAAFLGTKEGAKGPSKDTRREFSNKGEVEKYLSALLETGADPHSGEPAVRSVTSAAALGLVEAVRFLGERAIAIAGREKKPRKEHFVQLYEALNKFGVYEKAVLAGEIACKLDPTDSRLAADVRNTSAQQTMSKGGFDQAGESGGFRANIRDAEKQKRLALEEKVVKTETDVGRLLELARADYEARPADKPAIRKYARALLERGSPGDEETAHQILLKAYADTQEFDFRRLAGEIRIRQSRRKISKLATEAEAAGGNGPAKEALDAARRELLDMEIVEYQARVKAYPTELSLKFELGKRLYDAGRYEESIALFQEAKAEVKNRQKVILYLGNAFERIGFHDGAVGTFREGLDANAMGGAPTDAETTLELRYGLMLSLEGHARETSDLAAAEEAHRIASAIAMQQFNFKDVRARQLALKQLIQALKGVPGSAGGAAGG